MCSNKPRFGAAHVCTRYQQVSCNHVTHIQAVCVCVCVYNHHVGFVLRLHVLLVYSVPLQGGSLAMPSFRTLLRRIADLWSRNQEDLEAKVSGWVARWMSREVKEVKCNIVCQQRLCSNHCVW